MQRIRPTMLFAAACAAAFLSACTSTSAGKATPGPSSTESPPAETASAGISSDPGGAPSGGASSGSTVGTLTYFTAGDNTAVLYSWRPGQAAPTKLGSFPAGGFGGSGNVSPDGTRASWVSFEDAKLHIANVDGTRAKVFPDTFDGTCNEPMWSSDGKRLLVAKAGPNTPSGALGWLNVDTGAFTKVADRAPGCHTRQTRDAKHYVYQDGQAQIWLSAGPTTNNATQVKVEGRLFVDYAAVSADGSRVAAQITSPGMVLGDVGRSLDANAIVDTRTGAIVDVPIAAELRQAFFTSDGGMVVRVRNGGVTQIALIDNSNHVVRTVTEPAALKDARLLRYTS